MDVAAITAITAGIVAVVAAITAAVVKIHAELGRLNVAVDGHMKKALSDLEALHRQVEMMAANSAALAAAATARRRVGDTPSTET